MTTPLRSPGLVLAAAMALALPLACAAGGSAAFQALDANGDGLLSRDELQAHPRLLRNFDAADTNHDGVVSKEEARAAREAHRAGTASR